MTSLVHAIWCVSQAELAVAQRHQDELSTTHEVDVEELRGMLQERHEALVWVD